MPRRPRVFVENGFYHLILRGNSRAALFRDERDRRSFQSLVIASELLATIRKPGRTRDHARVRASISASAIDDNVATLTELANYFGRSVAAMARTIARYRHGQPDQ